MKGSSKWKDYVWQCYWNYSESEKWNSSNSQSNCLFKGSAITFLFFALLLFNSKVIRILHILFIWVEKKNCFLIPKKMFASQWFITSMLWTEIFPNHSKIFAYSCFTLFCFLNFCQNMPLATRTLIKHLPKMCWESKWMSYSIW